MGISRYEINTTSTKAQGSRLLYVTYSKFENDWPSLLHAHQFAELTYIISGRGFFQVEDCEYPIHKDDFIIVNPNTIHTEKSTGDEPLEYVILGVENLNFTFEEGNEHIIFSCANDSQDLMFYMNTLLTEQRERGADYSLVCQNILEVLLIKLIRRTNFAFDVTPSAKISQECVKLKRFIEMNYTQDITLDQIAEISHLNKYYLVHMFNKYCGCSPINYLCQIRIQASKELLASTDYSITEIAQLSGFSSQSYFAQCFQKSCHMTASAYRKGCQKKLTHISGQ